MARRALLTLTLILSFFVANAQTPDLKVKKIDYYAGVQVNQLLKQLINLNNSNQEIDNPYLLTFSMNCKENGWGGQVGFGYNYQKVTDDLSPADHVSSINDLFYRVGAGRKVMVGKKFQAGYGIDFIGNYLSDKTTTISVSPGIDSTISDSNTKTVGYGTGLQASMGFFITDRLLISTEMTYYFLQSKEQQHILVTSYQLFNNPPTQTTSNFNSETKISDITFTLPVAIFLVLKF